MNQDIEIQGKQQERKVSVLQELKDVGKSIFQPRGTNGKNSKIDRRKRAPKRKSAGPSEPNRGDETEKRATNKRAEHDLGDEAAQTRPERRDPPTSPQTGAGARNPGHFGAEAKQVGTQPGVPAEGDAGTGQ